jgi:DNA modification methylase
MQPTNTILTEDARELARAIPDESIDLIFTDPPYIKEQMYLYSWLSQEADRVLKPNGFLFAYVGTYWKFEAMQLLATHLTYYWDCIEIHTHNKPFMWATWARSTYKSIVVFCKSKKSRPRKQYFDAWSGGGEDKRYHHWGQDESTARYYIDCFSALGETILDPFCGGGTVPAICTQLRRNFIAFEIDPQTADIARTRLQTVQPFLFDEQDTEQLPLNLIPEEEVAV